jgi:hypothetical protein
MERENLNVDGKAYYAYLKFFDEVREGLYESFKTKR